MSVYIKYLSGGSSFSDQFSAFMIETAGEILEENGLAGGEVGIIIAGSETVHKLNREYRHKDYPTDVLSFSYLEPVGTGNRFDRDFAVGDIYISYEQALSQAEEAGHSIQRETALLIIHGMLHLSGYDHEDESDADRMEQAEQFYLKRFDSVLDRGEING
jgi:probable rRNA maturation factor